MEEQQHLFKDTFLAAVLDQMDTNFYITDVETDEILYMNKTMKETFGLARPEGCICWQVLQKDMKERCPYCKIRQLEQMEDNRICIWRETNSVTGRKYRNYDSLIQWKGKVYHIQNSVDMTEFDQISETARTDELTRMLNRRGGGERLRQALEQGGRENQVVTVVLYDINELKAVNDRYGHSEGDRLLQYVAAIAKECLGSCLLYTSRCVLETAVIQNKGNGSDGLCNRHNAFCIEAQSLRAGAVLSLGRRDDVVGVFQKMVCGILIAGLFRAGHGMAAHKAVFQALAPDFLMDAAFCACLLYTSRCV